MTRKPEAAQVSLPSDREVEVARAFEAPRTVVWEAFTKPELMRRWLLGPPGWTMPVCEMDVRVGGSFRWHWQAAEDATSFGFHGEFIEVHPPAMLRHTEVFDPGDTGESMGDDEAVVTVRFMERDGVTTVTSLIEYASPEDRDAALATGMTDGMEASYQQLDALLAERPPD